MSVLRFTGHPFLDAGTSGIAAILEAAGSIRFASPEELQISDIDLALTLLGNLYRHRVPQEIANAEPSKHLPLCTFLLQEVMPGSSWDQAKGKPDNQIALFDDYVRKLRTEANKPPIGKCFITGGDAHIYVSKLQLPLLASSSERPNCYPNLDGGYHANAWLALAVLFSPLGIEKTIKVDGGGSKCIIYHSTEWQFMVEVARRNLLRLNSMIASGAISEYRNLNYKGKSRSGTYKMAISTIRHALSRVDASMSPQVTVWSFNASNKSCHYDCVEASQSLLVLRDNRQLYPNAYRELPRCSELVSRLILEGKPIAQASIVENFQSKNVDRLTRTKLCPGWALQRLYAEKALNMPTRFLNAIENAAKHLAQDHAAVQYCLYSERLKPVELALRFKLPREVSAVFSDHASYWRDYLRAAVVWASTGNDFGKPVIILNEPGPTEMLLQQVSVRLRDKHTYKRLAFLLSVPIPQRYRESWLRLLRDGACTWKDFLDFNPLEEALSIGNYSLTRIRRDYLIAYLLGCANESAHDLGEEENIEEHEPNQLDDFPTILDYEEEA